MVALTLASRVCGAASGETQSATDAKSKLAAVRSRIAQLTGRIADELKERDALDSRLRAADLAITSNRLRLEQLASQVAAVERQRSELDAERVRTRAALEAERGALADEVRAQYMLGRADELRMLLSQTNPGEVGRVVAYYGYFARARADQIARISDRERELTELGQALQRSSATLAALEADAARQVSGLEGARTERAHALAAVTAQVHTGNEQLGQLHKEEQSVESLIADLERVLKDFPVDRSAQRFDQMRGRLPWPVAGKLTIRRQETRTNGAPSAVRWNGVLIDTARGARVRTPFAGRVVYADWLQGMGMLLIVAHGGNYMTLYGHTEVLYKAVGDSVAAGEVIAAVSDAGGAQPELYFEIRNGREPLDPKAWLKPNR